jgi:hypothetical protein
MHELHMELAFRTEVMQNNFCEKRKDIWKGENEKPENLIYSTYIIWICGVDNMPQRLFGFN